MNINNFSKLPLLLQQHRIVINNFCIASLRSLIICAYAREQFILCVPNRLFPEIDLVHTYQMHRWCDVALCTKDTVTLAGINGAEATR